MQEKLLHMQRNYLFVEAIVNIRKVFCYLSIFILCNVMWWVIKHYIFWCDSFSWMEVPWPHNFCFICAKNSHIHCSFCYETEQPIQIQFTFYDANKRKNKATLQILFFLYSTTASCCGKVIIQNNLLLIGNSTLWRKEKSLKYTETEEYGENQEKHQ